jgi:hypothetical protein
MSKSSREVTNKLIELMDDDIIRAYELARACLRYMNEAEVKDMAYTEGFVDDYVMGYDEQEDPESE